MKYLISLLLSVALLAVTPASPPPFTAAPSLTALCAHVSGSPAISPGLGVTADGSVVLICQNGQYAGSPVKFQGSQPNEAAATDAPQQLINLCERAGGGPVVKPGFVLDPKGVATISCALGSYGFVWAQFR